MKNKYLLLLALVVCTLSQSKTIEMVADTIQWRPSELPGYRLTLQSCTTCHSAHYAEYQPPNTSNAYWNAQVLRMKNIFKAQVSDDEVPVIVEYLNKTYGANRK